MKFVKYCKFLPHIIFLSILLSGICSAESSKDVNQLTKSLEKQQKAIDALTKKVEDLESSKGNQSIISNDLKFYGQINRGILYTDDGNESNVYHVDNDNSSTRVGLLFNKNLLNDMSMGGKMEFEFQVDASDEVNQSDTALDDDHFRKRHIDIFIEAKKYGKVSIGHGSMASDGSSEIDLSGTSGIGYSSVGSMAGGHFFYDSDASTLSTTTVKSVFNNMDGLGRKNRIRYDSPQFSRVIVSTSVESDGTDLAVNYSTTASDIQIVAGAAIAHFSSSSVENQFNGSISALHSKGYNLTLAIGNRSHEDSARDNGKFIYLKAGYKKELNQLGETAFAFDIGSYNDISSNSDDGMTFSLMAVQNINRWSSEIYCGYRNYNLDRNGADYDSINALFSGVKVKF